MIVFAEIQCLWFSGNPLAGIIGKFSALACNCHDTAFGTQDLLVVDFCTMQAVAAATFYSFPKQHEDTS